MLWISKLPCSLLSFAYIKGAALNTSFQLWGNFWKKKNYLKAQEGLPGKDRLKINMGSLIQHVSENKGHIMDYSLGWKQMVHKCGTENIKIELNQGKHEKK